MCLEKDKKKMLGKLFVEHNLCNRFRIFFNIEMLMASEIFIWLQELLYTARTHDSLQEFYIWEAISATKHVTFSLG